jgi:hypothetical protein
VERPRVEFDNIREMESLIAPEKLVRSKEESASDAQ